MIAKGQITYILRDAITLDVIEEHVVDNIITEAFYDALNKDMNLNDFYLCVNGKSMASSRWTTLVPGNNNSNIALVNNGAIPGVAAKSLFPKSGATPLYFQFSGRFNPPVSVTRVIKTVMLTSNVAQATFDSVSVNTVAIYAYTSLNTPCSQNNSQVLDIYYRVFFPVEAPAEEHLVNELITRYQLGVDNSTLYNNSFVFPTPIVTKLKAGDEGRSMVGISSMMFGGAALMSIPATHVTASPTSPHGSYKYVQQTTAFADYPGVMYTSVLTGGKGNPLSRNKWALNSSADTLSPTVMASTVLRRTSKIQNLIGHSTTVKANTATPWLDVDNLPNGSGKIYITGDWANLPTPSMPGLYYKALVPEFNCIQITDTGKISDGTAKYTYFKQPFFGYRNLPNTADAAQSTSTYTQSAYTLGILPSLCATAPAVGSPSSAYWRLQTYDAGKTIVEEITTAYMDTAQLSASHRYDDGSFILVKKNKLILYSIGAGDYWKFNGPYTEIHQIAVVQGKIYVACRNTGLYVIDPLNSLDVVSLSTPEAGIDLSKCYGVAKGYGNSVWAVGDNGLMKLQAGVWTKYDEASASPFVLTGISNAKWSNVEYLKVDEESVQYEMFLVRKITADVDSTIFGVWWSPSTGATNSFLAVTNVLPGMPRFNRTHFGGMGGMWAISHNGYQYVGAFKTAPVVVAGSAITVSSKWSDIYSSIFFVKNSLGEPRLMSMVVNSALSTNAVLQSPTVKLINAAAQVTDTVLSGLLYGKGSPSSGSYYNTDPFGQDDSRARASAYLGGSYNDCAASIILDKGVMVTLWCGTENKANVYIEGAVGTYDNLIVGVSNYALDRSLSGGPLAYLARKTYGWTGSAWSESVTTPKTAHLTEEALLDGVKIRFEEGAANNSFVTPNYYRFGLCEGILKDNATRSYFYIKIAPRRVVKITELSAYLIPAPAALPVGIVGVDTARSSPGAYLNASNRMQFPLEGGAQYAFGDKQVNGDFEISFNPAGISSIININSGMMFGVGKSFAPYYCFFGFCLDTQTLYTQIGQTQTASGVPLASVTSLTIKRISGVMTAWINGVLKATADAGSGTQPKDRLDVLAALPNTHKVVNTIADRYAPVITIVSNGSDSMLAVGHAGNKTGSFAARFNGLADVPVVTIDGVVASVTALSPIPAGSITHTDKSGYIHFSPDDVGKTVTVSTQVYQSE